MLRTLVSSVREPAKRHKPYFRLQVKPNETESRIALDKDQRGCYIRGPKDNGGKLMTLIQQHIPTCMYKRKYKERICKAKYILIRV